MDDTTLIISGFYFSVQHFLPCQISPETNGTTMTVMRPATAMERLLIAPIKNQDSMTKILDMVPDFVNKFTSGSDADPAEKAETEE